MGEELQEILQYSSNEEYTGNKHSEGSNVETDKEAYETKESAIQGEDYGRKNRKLPLLDVQSFSPKCGIEWRYKGPATQNAVCRSGQRPQSAAADHVLCGRTLKHHLL